MIPQSYNEWHHCITQACKIKMDKNFIQTRIAAMENRNDSQTISFIQLYGEEHYQNVLGWFYQADQTVLA